MEFNLQQAKRLLEMFGGEDATVTVNERCGQVECPECGHTHEGGLWAHYTEYPEEGSVCLQ